MITPLKLTRERPRFTCHVLCGLYMLGLRAHRRRKCSVYRLTTRLLPLLGSTIRALRIVRSQRRWLACSLRAVVSILLLHDTERSCAGVLLHVGVILGSLMRAIVGGVGVLLVSCGSGRGQAAGCGRDGLIVVLILLSAHEEEYGQANKCEAEKGSNHGASNPCLALALARCPTSIRSD
jgi:hypothetical protein